MSVFGLIGSSRRDGNTALLANAVFNRLDGARLYDLNDYAVAPYDYDGRYSDDDFHELAAAMAQARAIVFASPVYWYSMSAQLKAFVDRMTDLTDIWKPLGKSLHGRTMFVIATSNSDAAPESFTQVFTDTAGYFHMRWGGLLHLRPQEARRFSEAAARDAAAFAATIAAAAKG